MCFLYHHVYFSNLLFFCCFTVGKQVSIQSHYLFKWGGPLPYTLLFMTRYRAYSSDSYDSDGERRPKTEEKAASPITESSEYDSADEDESLSESGASSLRSSHMSDEDSASTAARTSSISRKGNALVEDKNGEIRYVHEVDGVPAHGPMDVDPPTIPQAQKLGVDMQKMNVMQTSLFRMPEQAAALKVLQQGKTSWKRLNLAPPSMTQPRKHGREPDPDISKPEDVSGPEPQEVCR